MWHNCGVEQLVARRAHNPEVAGSSPAPATKTKAPILVLLLFKHYFMQQQGLSKKYGFHKTNLIIIFISLFCFLFGQFVSALILHAFDLSIAESLLNHAELSSKEINVLKLAQFFSALLSFVLPSVFCAYLLYDNWKSQLRITKVNYKSSFYLIPLFLLLIMPFMNIIIQWNESIVFPDSLRDLELALRASEDSSQLFIKTLLQGTGVFTLIINILLIGALPALGEELFFRGLLQSHLNDYFKNPHIGIFISAFLFSAIHFQFYGFFPRLILGLIFGYLVYFSGSIWTTVFAHLFNNALAVIVVYFQNLGKISEEVESFGTSSYEIIYSFVCLALAVFVARSLIINFKKRNKIINLVD